MILDENHTRLELLSGDLPGRFSSGLIHAMMENAPGGIPADPAPAKARATMSIFELLTMPQRSEPISNRKKKERNVH